MPSPPNITNIPAPRVPLLDERTGLLSREWYRFFFNLFNLTGNGNWTSLQDLQLGPPSSPDDQFAVQQLAGALSAPDGAEQTAQIASLQAQVQGLALAPANTPHSPAPLYGAFYSTADQVGGSTTTAYPVVLDTTQTALGVILEDRTATFTASIGPASTTMTVTAISAGPIYPGMVITGAGVTAGTYIVSQTTGTDGSTGDYVVSVSQTVASTTITGTCKSKLKLEEAGVYNVQFSFQFVNTDSSIQDADIWLRKNGTDVADSNSQFSIPNRHGSTDGALIAALNLFVDAAPNDYIELMWAATNTAVTLQHIAAKSSPVRPVTPSAIVTVSLASGPSISGV